MESNYLGWKNTLIELNDFCCKVEFLNSKMRDIVACRRQMDIAQYLTSLRELINKHEQNLSLISFVKEANVFAGKNEIINNELYPSMSGN
ncbi:MAG: hypothetical protein H6613_13450 [Ignavibacteriales bacterium]|nr:hypothetical protein [Ignavibacteriota bacterium]MCB9249473.1 hypothetical protein [Ignavibacteriales bacterium]